ncbi:ABC transporter ATP-binding protein [Romboutsia sp.]|uniref:ABC transporter ATP-binding protein n=1 Tax=Romboutsia sp. TaxID=1965302 RepID=UPI002C6F8C5D|nr:ABC transporter ATP-binding protein [Romboutsia sp.]HSQ87971.1 ABC transporter ATP-binding protein [Romboutsia sp.]
MIVIDNLTKKYKNITAVDNLNLEIKKGEFFGLLGPNGAGKTTLIKMLSTLTKPTSGTIMIDDIYMDRNKTKVKSKIGVVSQHINLEWELSAIQNLQLHGKLFGMQKDYMQKRIDELLKYIDLYDRKDEKVKNFSGGMKRKLMIARALLHEPEVLLLDEPTVGLDASVRRKLWDLMKGLNKDGMTVILTTHYIEEAEVLCNRVGFFNNGKLVALDTPKKLIEKSGQFVMECFDEGQTKTLFFENREDALKKATSINSSVNIRQSNLEDTFIMLTNRRMGE